MKKQILKVGFLLILTGLCCCLVGCTNEGNDNESTFTASNSDKIPEEGLVDDMKDYISMLESSDRG